MKTTPLIVGLVCALLSTAAFAATQDPNWARSLDLEAATRASDLIIVVKVEKVDHIELMMGGKVGIGGEAAEQYKLKPLRVLKGVFARDELSLMSSDLGGYRYWNEMKQIQPGMVLMLFLGRSQVGYTNANGNAGSWLQSMPLLQDENDPLTDTVKTLLAMENEHEETKRVKILLDRLAVARGIDAIPLFTALERRAWVAAQNPAAANIVAKDIASPNHLVGDAASDTASQMLAQDYLKNEANGKELETALLAALDAKPPNVAVRNSLYTALGGLEGYTVAIPPLAAHLDPDQPVQTFGEQAAKLDAAGRINIAAFAGKVQQYLQKLPLDAPSPLEISCETALCRMNPDGAGDAILDRISKKEPAGLDAAVEIGSLGTLPPKQGVAALVKLHDSFGLWKSPNAGGGNGLLSFTYAASGGERQAFAQACLEAAKKANEEPVAEVAKAVRARPSPADLVDPLAALLDPDEPSRGTAIEALIEIGTDSAAKALQPHLIEEPNLFSKLRIAEFLGKHGITDGYPYAIEHMSDGWLLEQAVAALAAIKDPKTVPQLKQILATSNDTAWNSAAIRALGAMGAKDEADKFLEITGDWKNPLTQPALIALGDLGEIKALPKVREALDSRNDGIVISGARAAAKLLGAHPEAKADNVRDRLAELVAANDAGAGVRQAALDALVSLKDTRLDKALAAAANDPDFPHTASFLTLLKDHKIVLAAQ